MHFVIPQPVSTCLILSAAHGFTDIVKKPAHIWPYVFVLLPLHSDVVTFVFMASSVCHFSHDVGWATSVFLHLTLAIATAVDFEEIAWVILCAYMYLIHIPKHVASSTRLENAITACAFCLLIPLCRSSMYFGEFLQKIVICHIIVAETISTTKKN